MNKYVISMAAMLLVGCSQSAVVEDETPQVEAKNTEQKWVSLGDTMTQQITIGEQVSPHTQSVLHGYLDYDSEQSTAGAGKFRFRLVNPTEQAVDIQFYSGMTADLLIFDANNKQKWAWSETMMFTQALSIKRLQSGEEMVTYFQVPKAVMTSLAPLDRIEVRLAGKVSTDGLSTLHPVIIPIY